jgi:hypothetical protein
MRVTMATEPAKAGHPNEEFVGATPAGVVLLDGAGRRGRPKHRVHTWRRVVRPPARRSATRPHRQRAPGPHCRTRRSDRRHSSAAPLHMRPRPPRHAVRYGCSASPFRRTGATHRACELCVCRQAPGRQRRDHQRRPRGPGRQSLPLSCRYHAEWHARADNAVRAYVETLRQHRNQPNGFWVAAADPTAAQEALKRSWPRSEVDAVAVLSDGASRLVDRFHLNIWLELIQLLDAEGPSGLLRRVRDAEQSDLDGSR